MFELTPFAGIKDLSRYFANFENMEKTFLSSFNPSVFSCSTDIIENKNEYVLRAEMPGFDKEDIDISVNHDSLTISASHKNEKEERDENANYIRRERSCGSFSRSFDISHIKADEISASYKNGVLELLLPKKDINEDAVKKINIL